MIDRDNLIGGAKTEIRIEPVVTTETAFGPTCEAERKNLQDWLEHSEFSR